ncbi:hypothetical protein F5I97DRAFT_1930424 [Phlebopus sp. FC_14]|nr:hypothetical protein F5I97DRAFT_1930424 [Phlebopus sp. FC_14]
MKFTLASLSSLIAVTLCLSTVIAAPVADGAPGMMKRDEPPTVDEIYNGCYNICSE